MIRKIIDVKTTDDYSLICEMENGEIFKYDMSYLKTAPGPMPAPLKELNFFKQVELEEYGNLSWPNGYEISANTVALDGKLLSEAMVS